MLWPRPLSAANFHGKRFRIWETIEVACLLSLLWSVTKVMTALSSTDLHFALPTYITLCYETRHKSACSRQNWLLLHMYRIICIFSWLWLIRFTYIYISWVYIAVVVENTLVGFRKSWRYYFYFIIMKYQPNSLHFLIPICYTDWSTKVNSI